MVSLSECSYGGMNKDAVVLIRKAHTVLPKWVSMEAFMAQWATWSCEMGLVNTHISQRNLSIFRDNYKIF